MDGLDMFNEDIDKFLDMIEDFGLAQKDYYDEFSKMCLKYSDSSIVPYSLCHELITGEYPCEEYYMPMLMDVYSYYNIGEYYKD